MFRSPAIKLVKSIYKHPINKGRELKSVFRFITWQLISRIYKHPILLPFTDKSVYLCWSGLTGLTGNWYYGLMEMEEMSFLLHFIRDNDCFFDIGANAGAYSILACQHSQAQVHAFEPHPVIFKHLKRNILIQNNTNNIILHNFALGDTIGQVEITAELDTENHITKDSGNDNIHVEIKTIDSLNINLNPTIIKIDVEGYEWNVLQGANKIIQNSDLKAIIIELNGAGTRYGIPNEKIDNFLRAHSFLPYTYNPFQRELIKLEKHTNRNTIYIRDADYCEERVKTSSTFRLSNNLEL